MSDDALPHTAPNTIAGDEPAVGTLHQRIRGEIEGRILSGEWRPGFRIPFEHELMAQYGCSRMTVHKAISELAGQGLLIRRRRAGSFVASPRIHSAVLDISDIQAEILQRGQAYAYELLEQRIRPPADPEEETLAAGEDLLSITSLHRAGGAGFAFEERVISLASVPDARTVDFSLVAPGAWLLDHVPWTEAEHRISAENAKGRAAAVLGITAGAACLILERRTWRGENGVTAVRQTFPGHLYDLMARFTPSRG